MQKHTILIIDDDCRELDIMNNVLYDAGYQVLVAEDGEIGYRRAVFARPDLILLDVMMPGKNGYETCKLLKGNKHTRNIPIFFKTCKGDGKSILDGYRAGIDRFITKPCNHDELLRLVKSRLASVQQDHLQTHLQLL